MSQQELTELVYWISAVPLMIGVAMIFVLPIWILIKDREAEKKNERRP